MYKGTPSGSQMESKSSSSIVEVTVVHGGDNALRARAASVLTVNETVHDRLSEIMNLTIDRVMIFSGAKTIGKDNPSEARKMYDIFLKRLKVLDVSERIPGGISFPKETELLNHWNIRVGDHSVAIYLEEESVDTEDNAEKSAKIIQKIFNNGAYDKFVVSPLSSDFHMKRIEETFERHMLNGGKLSNLSDSAEKILKDADGKYKKYGELKEKSIGPKTKLLEVILRVASRFEGGRKKIREITQKRLGK